MTNQRRVWLLQRLLQIECYFHEVLVCHPPALEAQTIKEVKHPLVDGQDLGDNPAGAA